MTAIKSKVSVALATMALALASQQAKAIPELQLYIEGSTYDSSSETWVLSTAGSFNLWVIGNVDSDGAGRQAPAPILDVHLVAAVSGASSGSVTLTPTTATGITDPSISGPVTALGLSYGTPKLNDGTDLPSHGEFPASFYEWKLGDFTLTDSPIGDFINSYPTSFPATGQINAYQVSVTGYTAIHFDSFDHVQGKVKAKYVFAPFSHDAEGNTTPVPEPETYAMLLAGLGLMGFVIRRRRGRVTM